MGQETEAKFYLSKPSEFRQRLVSLGARISEPRVFERNLRFDRPDRQLSHSGQVLRLRQDTRARLTYKGLGDSDSGALSRRELETDVGDFEETQALLEALGYEVIFVYEKFRTTYELGGIEIMLDELPYGVFVELEGDMDSLRPVAIQLGLRWEASIPRSYSSLYEDLVPRRHLVSHDLTFDAISALSISAADLGVESADS